jgi:hypothetical protein
MLNRVWLGAAIAGVLLTTEIGLGAEPARWAEVARPPKFVSTEEWGSQPDPIPDERRHTPKYVTLHHAGVLWTADRDPVQFVRNMQAWGKRRPEIEEPPRNTYWPDLPYHFLIAPDGRIFEGRSLDYEPESNTPYELTGHLGVELMGNFEEQRPSPAQVESAVRLVAWLLAKSELPLEAISTHRSVAKGQTTCPGRDFARYFNGDPGQFETWVAAVLQGEQPHIDLGPPLENGPTELITATKRKDK